MNPVHAGDALPAAAELSPEEAQYLLRFTKLKEILSGELSTALYLEFLYSANKADLQILRNIKAATEVCAHGTHRTSTIKSGTSTITPVLDLVVERQCSVLRL